jgi:ubiquinol-cytochrome c reductase iron-sulfur subunit
MTGKGAGLAFAVSAVASLGLTIVYGFGGQPQLEGLLLFVALGGVGLGLVLWAHGLMPGGHFVEERKAVTEEAETRAGGPELAERTFEDSAERVGRRTFIGRMLAVALGALGIAALFPIRSLGSRPGRELFGTAWRAGSRLVTLDGTAVHADDLAVNGVATVFPEGYEGSADAQTLLIHLEPELEPAAQTGEPSAEGYVAYSKICTHAGCPVGLYQPERRQLFCPCHQSVFDLDRAAEPVEGPATRALPRLPIDVDSQGFLIARGDFTEPVGPGFWDLG